MRYTRYTAMRSSQACFFLFPGKSTRRFYQEGAMGGCWSDVRGGQQAVGGTQPSTFKTTAGTGGDDVTATGDALAHFFRSSYGAPALFTQLELSLSATKLLDRDILSKSDPMAVGYVKKRDGVLEEIGRTEVIMNSLSPVWIGKFSIAYHFEIVQPLVFHVYDIDTKYHNVSVKNLKLKEQEFLGEANCVLSEIVTKHSKSLVLKLQRKDGHGVTVDRGSLSIHAEEATSSRQAFEMTLHCTQLKNMDRFSKSDPFLRISKIVEGGSVIPICKTEVVMNNLNPSWKPICLSSQQLGSKDNPLVIECLDFDDSGNHELIGKLQKSVADLEKLFQDKVGTNFFKASSGKHDHMKLLKGQLFVDAFAEKTVYC